MDESLSHLSPSSKIGNDGLSWWVGQIEGTASDEENNKGGYRFKVAIVGRHLYKDNQVTTADLPWANVIMPVNQPFAPGNITGAAAQLTPGCWVIGFYLDNDHDKPIIMGSIGQTPGSTTLKQTIRTNSDASECRFETGDRTGRYAVDIYTDGNPGLDSTSKQNGGPSDGTIRGDGEFRVDAGAYFKNVKDEDWCQLQADTCDDIDTKTQMKNILGQMLADIQASDGNIGDFYVSKYTGGIYGAADTARVYVNKAVAVVRELLARIKGFITSQIQKGVQSLVNAVVRPNESGNVLTPITEFFNGLLKDLGCKMEDLSLRLAEWLTNLIMSYVENIYRAAICHIDEFVNGIISKIYQLMNELLNSILGPLGDLLGAIAAPLNLIGNAINYILKLLGISCSGPDESCSNTRKFCTNGAKEGKDTDKNFLDNLLDSIDNLFGDTPADYTQYVCEEAYTGKPLEGTTVGFVGGIPLPNDEDRESKIVYDISDIEVTEGNMAEFTVKRFGSVDIASSVKFKTLDGQGSATAGTDYLAQTGIVPFTAGVTEAKISIQTLIDNESDDNETFFVKLTNNSPEDSIPIKFKQNIGKCTIIEKNLKEPYDPFSPTPIDPFAPIDDTPPSNFPTDDDTIANDNPTFNVIANRTTCPEDDFIIYTVTTTNIPNGSILYYTLTGNDITPSDIVGNKLTGEFVIQDNTAKITVGIAEDSTVEDEETLTFTVSGTGASVDVLIITDDDQSIKDFDNGIGDDPSTVVKPFRFPVVDPSKIITDGGGGIIEIPVDSTGDKFAEPPVVFVSGEGVGATATALLDDNGFVTEIRIESSGFGYKKNLAADNDVRCIIDAFTILSPGLGYKSAPDMYVDGELGIAEAVVNDDGFVIGARVLDRTRTYDKFPVIEFIGGGGYGARLLPSLACLNTDALTTIGATKIGTGKYIDCP